MGRRRRRADGPKQDPSAVERVRRSLRIRLVTAAVCASIGFAVLAGRLYSIQVGDHERFRASAENMHTRREPVLAHRGDILTRDGVILARNELVFDIAIDPSRIAPERIGPVVDAICETLGTSAEYRRERAVLARQYAERGRQFLSLGRSVARDVARRVRPAVIEAVKSANPLAVIVERRSERRYPRGAFAASVVGVSDREERGVEGLERAFDAYLAPKDGTREVQVGAHPASARAFRPGNGYVAAVPGYDVVTTIDSRLQSIVETQLEWGVKRMRAQGGVCIVLDCRHGDILALANYPTYDPNQYEKYPERERAKRRRNRAVEDAYEPGSVVKGFILAKVLEHGVAARHERIRSILPAGVRWDGGKRAVFGRRPVTDVHAHPGMTVEQALYQSSNIGMSALGIRLGRARMVEMLDAFGFGRPTGVLLPAEVNGRYQPPEEWKPFQSIVSLSFGYAVMVSPVQLASAFAALVNGGKLLRPRIVDRVERDGIVHRFPRGETVGRPISEDVSRQMREILAKVIEDDEGTAKWIRVEGFRFGGKTGTADIATNGRYTKTNYLASFEAFAPVDDPEVVVLCMIEKPRDSIYGGMVSGPVVVQILRHMYRVDEVCRLEKMGAAGPWIGW